MGAVIDQFNRAFRDFNTDGVAASGLAEVDKADARAIGPIIEQAVAQVGLGALISARFATLAAANASLAYPDGAVAIVYADATATNNDLIVKSGASGTGNWVVSGIILGIIQAIAGPAIAAATQAATLAGHYANDATNTDVPGAPAGSRGARYWALQAAASAATIAGIISRVLKYPGWLLAIKGSGRRLVWGIKDSGAVWAYLSEIVTLNITALLSIAGSLRIGAVALKVPGSYPGVFWAYIDGSRRKIWALLTDGTIWAYRAQAVTLTAGTIRVGSASVYNASWIVFTAPDASGNYQVYKQSRATGQVTALTTSGNHTDLKINGSVAAWLTDGTYSDYCDLDAGTSGPVTARPLLWAVGHSMLANYASNRQPPLPDKVASALNWPLVNFAIQGAGSAQQVARAGLVATTLTVTGNMIPASGPVTITAVTPTDFIVSAYGPRSIYGWLGGVYGYLTWDSAAGERFWRATAGDAVPISAGATWIPDVGLAFSGVALIWTLVNDDHSASGRAASLANLNTIVAALKALGKRFIILREFPRTTDTIGSASRADIDALNAAVQAAYPNNWLDLMPTLYANAAPSDATAVSQGLVPPSLSAGDGFHLGNAGNDLATVAIVNFIKAKGWA